MQPFKLETANQPRLDAGQLSTALTQFTGTALWYRHSLNKRLLYTDGVRYFAKNGGELSAYWLLDKTALEICPLLDRTNQAFGVVSVIVNIDHTADIVVTDGNEAQLLMLDIPFTDLQTGKWRFYLIEEGDHRVMCLPSEY